MEEHMEAGACINSGEKRKETMQTTSQVAEPMTLRALQLSKTPIKVLRMIFENSQKILPQRTLEYTNLNSLASVAEGTVPAPILGPSREEFFNGPTAMIPDSVVSRMVENDHRLDFRVHLDEAYMVKAERLKFSEKYVRRMARSMYTKRVSLLMNIDLPFKEKVEKIYPLADIEDIYKLHYWVYPERVSAPNMKTLDENVYLSALSQFIGSIKFVEGYLFYMRPPDPEIVSEETSSRTAAVLAYIHCMQCKLASLFDALDATILRSKLNSFRSNPSLAVVYGYGRNGKGTVMSSKSMWGMTEEIRKACPCGSESLIESLIASFDRLTSLVARWELITVDRKRDVKTTIAAGMSLAWLVNGHLNYLLNMIMSVYVLWLPEHYLNPRLVLAVSSRVLLNNLLATNPQTLRENAACPKMLYLHTSAEWRRQERGTEAWLNYVCAKAWLKTERENFIPKHILGTNMSTTDISDFVLRVISEPHDTANTIRSSGGSDSKFHSAIEGSEKAVGFRKLSWSRGKNKPKLVSTEIVSSAEDKQNKKLLAAPASRTRKASDTSTSSEIIRGNRATLRPIRLPSPFSRSDNKRHSVI
ncbi:Tegument protein UL46 [Cacatuid alphaherpesvirus 2]|uniref:Tegument protein UL46 n=1 Tax=Cacatuid alphaherpesvirus 2 TaxID=2604840 RepID=A0A5B9QZW6_9ALPH|nr:Tegument protein UL46 [Cacatuid alphaherpesvirus 2]QEG54058.1 Tegument protein UL46 [Cacatuid alphaherpesvirus 2]